MVELDKAGWKSLTDAYGGTGNIPPLLQQL